MKKFEYNGVYIGMDKAVRLNLSIESKDKEQVIKDLDIHFALNISNEMVIYEDYAITDNILYTLRNKVIVTEFINSMLKFQKYYVIVYHQDKNDQLEKQLVRKIEVGLSDKEIRAFRMMRSNIEG